MNDQAKHEAHYTSHRERMRMIGHLMLVRRILDAESAPAVDGRYAQPRVIDLRIEAPMISEIVAWEAVAS